MENPRLDPPSIKKLLLDICDICDICDITFVFFLDQNLADLETWIVGCCHITFTFNH